MFVHQHGPTVHRASPDDLQLIGCWRARQTWHDEIRQPTRRAPQAVIREALIREFEEKRIFLCRVEGCWPGRGTDMIATRKRWEVPV